MDEEKTIKNKIDEIYGVLSNIDKEEIKKKKIKLMRRAKVRKRKMKKGWVGVLNIAENRNVKGEKAKVEGFVFNTKDGLYHTTDGREILFWEGKFPFVIQKNWKINPTNLMEDDNEKNETYGQPYIQAKMLKDIIIKKSKGASIIIWLLIIGAIGYGIYYLFTQGI